MSLKILLKFIGGASCTIELLRRRSIGVSPAMHGNSERTCFHSYGEVRDI